MKRVINIATITLLILSTGCDKYFNDDDWYKKYKNENTGLLTV